MSAVKSEDTEPEMIVRRLVHRMGYRYRLHDKKLPGKPDLVFRSRQKVIFVHGCFWHRHSCKGGQSSPATNAEYWQAKFQRNKIRDRKARRELRRDGWSVLIVWECQTKSTKRKKLKQ